MKNQIVIRPATLADCDHIVDFQLKMALETENLTLHRSTVAKGVEAVFNDNSKGRYYVANAGEQIIGCMLNTFEWSDWRNGTFVWFQSVWVEPAWRNQGVFKHMYDYVKDMVRESDELKGLRLYVFHSNQKAQNVYQALGMESESYRMFEWVKPSA